jgi:trehalose-phosphatase
MKYLFNAWDKVKRKLKGRYLFLFLDYDGTLTPVVEKIDEAILHPDMKNLLRELIALPKCRLAIISGRGLADVKRIIGMEELIYAGNHGLEIEGPKIKYKHPLPPGYKSLLLQIKNKLNAETSSIKGVVVEDKGICIAFHYRLVDKHEVLLAKTIFRDVTLPYKKNKLIKIRSGKMILEIRPPVEWGKDRAVLWLLARQQFIAGELPVLPIYLGDDKTDEDAFAVIRDKGITIFVGEPTISNADYYLKTSQEVGKFLKLIIRGPEINAGTNKS